VRKICILGKASGSRNLAPIDNPEWEIWTLGWDACTRSELLFEVHPRWHWEGKDRADYYKTVSKPVYMMEHHEDIPTCIKYPLDEVGEIVGMNNEGKPYLECSISYMLGIALKSHIENQDIARVGIWGVDLRGGTEWIYQKANLNYLVGLARGLGMKVFIPKESGLLSSNWQSGIYGYIDPKEDAA